MFAHDAPGPEPPRHLRPTLRRARGTTRAPVSDEDAVFDGERVKLHEATLQSDPLHRMQLVGHSRHGSVRVTRHTDPLGTVTYEGTIGKRRVTGRPTSTSASTQPANQHHTARHAGSRGGGGGGTALGGGAGGGLLDSLFGWALQPTMALLGFVLWSYFPILALFGVAHLPPPGALILYATIGVLGAVAARVETRVTDTDRLKHYSCAAAVVSAALLAYLVAAWQFQTDGTPEASIAAGGVVVTLAAFALMYVIVQGSGWLSAASDTDQAGARSTSSGGTTSGAAVSAAMPPRDDVELLLGQVAGGGPKSDAAHSQLLAIIDAAEPDRARQLRKELSRRLW